MIIIIIIFFLENNQLREVSIQQSHTVFFSICEADLESTHDKRFDCKSETVMLLMNNVPDNSNHDYSLNVAYHLILLNKN